MAPSRGSASSAAVKHIAAASRSSGSASPWRAASNHSGLCGAGLPRERSASGFTVRYAVSAASGSSKSAVVTATGTIQPSSPGCASIIRSSRWPRGLTGGNSVVRW
ncbi:hypothetical protein SGLAM104S_09485 [Streptomyces glaucescens]